MRDHDDSQLCLIASLFALDRDVVDGVLHLFFALGVQSAGGFIED